MHKCVSYDVIIIYKEKKLTTIRAFECFSTSYFVFNFYFALLLFNSVSRNKCPQSAESVLVVNISHELHFNLNLLNVYLGYLKKKTA